MSSVLGKRLNRDTDQVKKKKTTDTILCLDCKIPTLITRNEGGEATGFTTKITFNSKSKLLELTALFPPLDAFHQPPNQEQESDGENKEQKEEEDKTQYSTVIFTHKFKSSRPQECPAFIERDDYVIFFTDHPDEFNYDPTAALTALLNIKLFVA